MTEFIQMFTTGLNNSKLFAGTIMILLNVGSKFIPITFSSSAEKYLKSSISKEILVFAMSWMGTRDVFYAIILTCIFILISDYLLNYDSKLCIVPEKYKTLAKLMDEDNDGEVSEQELNQAIQILEKSKKSKQNAQQKQVFAKYFNYSTNGLS